MAVIFVFLNHRIRNIKHIDKTARYLTLMVTARASNLQTTKKPKRTLPAALPTTET